MGRESVVACMPTMFISGGSWAPMENSPPGIQTIPLGAGPGAGCLFGTVGPNATPVPGAGFAPATTEEERKRTETIANNKEANITGTRRTDLADARVRPPMMILAAPAWRDLSVSGFTRLSLA